MAGEYTFLPDVVAQGGGFMNPDTAGSMNFNPSQSWDTFGLEPNSALQLNMPAATWKDKILGALANPGLMGAVAKMGSAMTDPRSPMKAIGAGVGDIGTIMQYNNAMKKAGLGGVGSALANGGTGMPLDFQNRTLGEMGFQSGPSTGLSGADVIGLPIDVVKGIYDTAAKQDQQKFERFNTYTKLLLDTLNSQSTRDYQKALMGESAARTKADVFKTEKEQRQEHAWNSYIESIDAGRVGMPKGLTYQDWQFVKSVDPAHGEDLIKAIRVAKESVPSIHWAQDDKYLYGIDPASKEKVFQMPINKEKATKDPALQIGMQNAAISRTNGRILAHLQRFMPANEYEELSKMLIALSANPYGPAISNQRIEEQVEKLGNPELTRYARAVGDVYAKAANEKTTLLEADREVDKIPKPGMRASSGTGKPVVPRKPGETYQQWLARTGG